MIADEAPFLALHERMQPRSIDAFGPHYRGTPGARTTNKSKSETLAINNHVLSRTGFSGALGVVGRARRVANDSHTIGMLPPNVAAAADASIKKGPAGLNAPAA